MHVNRTSSKLLDLLSAGLPGRQALRLRAGQALIVLAVPLVVLAGVNGTSAASTTSIHGSVPGCSVTVDFVPSAHPTSAVAHITSGCTGGDWWLTSWAAQSDVRQTSFPQTLDATTNAAPWTVPLPACYWQVDFSERSSAPGTPSATHQTLVAAKLGGQSCGGTTTTTVPQTTTTVPQTTTTVPQTTTTVPQTTTTVPQTTTTVPQTTTTVPQTTTTVPQTTTTVPQTTTTVPQTTTTVITNVTTTVPQTTTTVPGSTTTTVPGATTTTPPVTTGGTTPEQGPPSTSPVVQGQGQFAQATPTAAEPAATGTLAFTGSNSLLLLGLAGLAITLGVVAVRGARPAPRRPRA